MHERRCASSAQRVTKPQNAIKAILKIAAIAVLLLLGTTLIDAAANSTAASTPIENRPFGVDVLDKISPENGWF